LFFLSGTGKAILDDKETVIGTGDVVVVTPGTKHNFINTGSVPLKVYTIYAPANYIDGRIHVTKADADKDEEDESFGELVK
jgi:mannose-6-phosphate isomerase-like protein (cupin superfamily)